MNILAVALALVATAWLLAGIRAAHGATLAEARSRGRLTCGVVSEAPDWNREDQHGDLSALGVEICRAVALAALGRDATELHAMPAEPEALHALQAGQVDVVVGVTPSATRALRYGVAFGPTVFWDSQGLMVRGATVPAAAMDLAGRTVCFIDGTDEAGVLLAAMRARGIAMRPFPFQEEGEMAAALAGGHCAAVSAHASRLATLRAQLHAGPRAATQLPDRLAVAPASLATRQDDAAWSLVVAATVETLVAAEMAGITRANLAAHRGGTDPVVRHLLGEDWSAGQALGLARDWSAKVIGELGNYGEVFDRTVGAGSPLGLERGLNATCLQGGAMCAAPVR